MSHISIIFLLNVLTNFVLFQILIKAGAKINLTDRNECTPLYKAAFHGRPVLLDMLLKAGKAYKPWKTLSKIFQHDKYDVYTLQPERITPSPRVRHGRRLQFADFFYGQIYPIAAVSL